MSRAVRVEAACLGTPMKPCVNYSSSTENQLARTLENVQFRIPDTLHLNVKAKQRIYTKF